VRVAGLSAEEYLLEAFSPDEPQLQDRVTRMFRATRELRNKVERERQ
jgi:hypothetical protein